MRLTQKLAERVNGVDLSGCEEGDVIEVTARAGGMLIAEGWAEPASAGTAVTRSRRIERAVAADRVRPKRRQPTHPGWGDHRFGLPPPLDRKDDLRDETAEGGEVQPKTADLMSRDSGKT